MPAKKTTAKKAAPKKAKPQPIDSSAEFEKLLQTAGNGGRFVLRLFITGNTVRSAQAIANIRALCDEYLPGRYDLEVIDIYQQPGTLAKEKIIAAPTLIKQLPEPVKRVIGDLSDRDKVLIGLDLARDDAAKKPGKTRWVKL